ncbi:MAG: hypothetical protein KatS3mg031_1833 [Chitinophagales bacterium]|nr:MAG: hypothetical protein KatS3mg031_1833 [Chitinophagales bacterium]
MHIIYYLPVCTFLLSLAFSIQLYHHWRQKSQALYLFWWLVGVLTYGAGTLTESLNTLLGWSELNFRLWYISGALLGGAPLAQGTVYLLLKRPLAHLLTAILVVVVISAAICVSLSPIDYTKVDTLRMSGKVLTWQWVRYFSPFINVYALAFLAGGAVYSAIGYLSRTGTSHRFWGNLLIAVGALLPGIGGMATRFNFIELLYITELVGLLLIYIAYRIMRAEPSPSIHAVQRMHA